MRIYESSLAVTKHPIKKVRFEKGSFRGRPVERSIVYEVIEERPAAFMANGSLVCHPSLYRQFKAKVDIHNSQQGTFRMPPQMPMTMDLPPAEALKIGRWDYGMKMAMNPRAGAILSDIVTA
jgi:hypothetical protein